MFLQEINSPMVSNQRVSYFKSTGPGLFNIGGKSLPPPSGNQYWLKKLVLVKIGKSIKIGIGIGMLFLLEEKIGISMVFTLQIQKR